MYHRIRLAKTAGQLDFDPNGSYLGPLCKALVDSGMGINIVSIGRRESEFFFRGQVETPFLVMMFDLARQHGRMEYNLLAQGKC